MPPKVAAKATVAKAKAPAGGRAGAQPKAKSASSAAASRAPVEEERPWPPKVPLGPMEDVLPMIAEDDDIIDTLLLHKPGAAPVAADDEDFVPGSGLGFGPRECEYVCECLQKNSTVTSFSLSYNAVGDIGAAHVATLLSAAKPPPLMRLTMNDCGVGDEGAAAIAAAIAANKSLQTLELMNNRIGQPGAEALLEMLKANRTLRQLSVGFNDVPDDLQTKIERQLMIR